jgi:hypothetical protein
MPARGTAAGNREDKHKRQHVDANHEAEDFQDFHWTNFPL